MAQQRYTGTTSATTTTMTGERRAGALIASGDSRCATTVYTRWSTASDYMCIDGDKWSYEYEEISYDGTNWSSTGNIRPLSLVESASTFCESSITYSWVLTSEWQCESSPAPVPPAPTPYSGQYLTIESESNNNTIYWKVNSGYTSSAKTISVSTDNGATWTAKTATSGGTAIATLNTGEKVLLKGENAAYYRNSFDSYDGGFTYKVYGNIMSLISGDSFTSATTLSEDYTFAQLFSNSSGLTDASNLVLPATTLVNYCYFGMFFGCTSLTEAPSILPATTLADWCYMSMFRVCTSLTTAPELPATTLGYGCYYAMFYNSTSLTTAPELPAATLTSRCYETMFSGCTSLNYIKCLATDISA